MIDGKSVLSAEPVLAVQLDGKGAWDKIEMDSVASAEHPFWLHIDYENEESKSWLQQTTLVPDYIRESLSGESNRPRVTRLTDSLFITLRSVNIDNDSLPDPLVALRIYISESLIITTRSHTIHAVKHIKDEVKSNSGPLNSSDWLVDVADALTEQASDFIDDLHGRIIELEDALMENEKPDRGDLAVIRKQLIILRRYLFPQRDVFSKLANDKIGWIADTDRRRLMDISDRLGRGVDDLDAAIARTSILSDEITSLIAEQTNMRAYSMSVLAAIFLPATFLTGLFGVNLGGIPGAGNSLSFAIFCVVLIAIGGLFGWILKRAKWF